MPTFQDNICQLGACNDAQDWIRRRGWTAAQREVMRPDWAMWLVDKMLGRKGWSTREEYVLLLPELLAVRIKTLNARDADLIAPFVDRWIAAIQQGNSYALDVLAAELSHVTERTYENDDSDDFEWLRTFITDFRTFINYVKPAATTENSWWIALPEYDDYFDDGGLPDDYDEDTHNAICQEMCDLLRAHVRRPARFALE